LANLRRLLPGVTSILMDAGTYEAHRHKTVAGNKKGIPSQAGLTDAENKLLQIVSRDNLRIEQESLSREHVAKVITELMNTDSGYPLA